MRPPNLIMWCAYHPTSLVPNVFQGGSYVDLLAPFCHPVQNHVNQNIGSGATHSITDEERKYFGMNALPLSSMDICIPYISFHRFELDVGSLHQWPNKDHLNQVLNENDLNQPMEQIKKHSQCCKN